MADAQQGPEERFATSAASSSARLARRRALLAIYATVPLAALAIWWFRREGFVADTPFWFLALLLVVTAGFNLASIAWLRRAPADAFRIEVRLGVSTLATTAVIYSIGWGPMLVVAYGVGFAAVLQEAGSASWRSGFAWSVIGVGLGQIAIETGLAPTLIDPGLSNAVAMGGLLCFGIVARVLGVKAAAAEDAEDALRDRGEQFLSLLEHAVDVIAVADREGDLVFVSPAVENLLGYRPADLVDDSIGAIVPTDEMERLVNLIRSLADHPGRSQTLELVLRHRDGSVRWVAATLTNPPGQWGDGVVLNMHDVTKQRELEAQLRHDALHDPLTGLWNRPAFTQYAEKACSRAARDGSTLALLFVDLDGFKQVNDTLGHGLGDEVLIQVTKRLRECLRGSEILARLGGDEFTVLIERVSGARDAIDIADRIHASLTRPLDGPHEVPFKLGASIGIALSEQGQRTAAELLRDADHAMYSAKRSGRSSWRLAGPGSAPSTAASRS